MIDLALESLAASVAKNAHAGQVDRLGVDYYSGHLSSVAQSLSGDSVLVAVGYLHDSIEDTDLDQESLKELLLGGYGVQAIVDSIVEAVVAISKVSDESYEDYLSRVKANPIARAVKIADIKNNSDESRGIPQDPNYAARVEKYRNALEYLS